MTSDERIGRRPQGEQARKHSVDGVPLLWRCPPTPAAIAIHVPAFGQTKEQVVDVLDFLCNQGFVSVALDAFQHGERGREDRGQISRRVFSRFRRSMWTMIGMTALGLPSIAEWARRSFGPQLTVRLTGLSMGGDIAIAAAPLIEVEASVNTVVATPLDAPRNARHCVG